MNNFTSKNFGKMNLHILGDHGVYQFSFLQLRKVIDLTSWW